MTSLASAFNTIHPRNMLRKHNSNSLLYQLIFYFLRNQITLKWFHYEHIMTINNVESWTENEPSASWSSSGLCFKPSSSVLYFKECKQARKQLAHSHQQSEIIASEKIFKWLITLHILYIIYSIIWQYLCHNWLLHVLTAENTHNYVLSNPFWRQTFRHQTKSIMKNSIMKNSLGVFDQTNLVYSRKNPWKWLQSCTLLQQVFLILKIHIF